MSTQVSLTLAFTVELSLNIFAHSNDCFRPFYTNSSNLMDLLIVMASLLALTSWVPGLPNTKSFRLLRVGRVIRLIKGTPLSLEPVSLASIQSCRPFSLSKSMRRGNHDGGCPFGSIMAFEAEVSPSSLRRAVCFLGMLTTAPS